MAAIDRSRWGRISPLLDELLEADHPTRAERLASLRQQDGGLADEIAALLAQQAEVETAEFLQGSALAAAGADALAGQVVGSYTLERPVGQGGMGSVWLARRSDGRYEGQAAVKFLNLALLGRGGAERFRREGSALARLAHPNIAHLVDAGVAPGGQPYLVLEYVEGEPIDRWCDERRLDVGARIGVFLQVLAAVAHAHGRLILHRDLKPTNILVTAEGRVKLLDFGIAKLLEDQRQPAAATELTQLSGNAFTPEYAAPEQLQEGEATTATDVYALGVLLYRLVTGAHPIETPAASRVERLRALVERESARASDAARRIDATLAQARGATPLKLARLLHGDLDNILARALKKAPAERYPTVEAMAADLQRYLNDEPVSARADSAAYRVTKFVRRHRVGVGAAAAVALALAGGVVATVWQAREAQRQRDVALQASAEARTQAQRAKQESDEASRQRLRAEDALGVAERQRALAQAARDVAEQQRELARASERDAQRSAEQARAARDRTVRELQRADATNRLMSRLLSEVSPDGKPFTAAQLLAQGEVWAAKLFAANPRLHAEMLLVLADRYADATDDKRALALFEQAYQLSRGVDAPELRGLLACRLGSQIVLGPLAGHDRGRRLIDEGLATLRSAGREPLLEAQCLSAAAYAESQHGNHRAAIENAERAVRLVDGHPDRRDDSLHAVVALLASMYTRAGRYAEAATMHDRTLRLMESSGLDGTVRMSLALNNAAHNLFTAGATLESVRLFDRVVALDRGSGPGAGGGHRSNLANALIQIGRTREAVQLHLASAEAARAAGSPVEEGRSLLGASNALREDGDLPAARQRLDQARAVLAGVLPPNHIGNAAIEITEARLQLAERNPQSAVQTAQSAIARFDRSAPRSTDRALALATLAQAQQGAHLTREAVASAEAAVRLARELASGFPYSFRIGFPELVRCEVYLEAALPVRDSCSEAVRHLVPAIGAEAPLAKAASAARARATRER
jgi:hypothetical protein